MILGACLVILIILFLNFAYSFSLRYNRLEERVHNLNRCFSSSFYAKEIKLISEDGETTSMPFYLDMAIAAYCIVLPFAFAITKAIQYCQE
jgi:hypothetical protein